MGRPASSRQGAPLGEGFFRHFVGGIHHPKSLLLSPYPAIPPYVVRTPHPGITDDREAAGVRPKSLITMELRDNRDNHVNGSLFLIVLWPSTRSRFAISGCSWSACGGPASNSIVISSFGRYLICVAEIADHDVSERKNAPRRPQECNPNRQSRCN